MRILMRIKAVMRKEAVLKVDKQDNEKINVFAINFSQGIRFCQLSKVLWRNIMKQLKILVVDDEKEIADLIEIYLVSDGYKVFKAENAEAGLSILDKQDIHLVLLDIMMPGMNGLEMCRKIRETNNIPIIMLSAKSTDLDKILGLGTGADDYVTKPFNHWN